MEKLVKLDEYDKAYLSLKLKMNEIIFLSNNFHTKLAKSRYEKHKFIGKKIKRRKKTQETIHGRYKSIVNALNDIKNFKKAGNINPDILNDELSQKKAKQFIKLIEKEVPSYVYHR